MKQGIWLLALLAIDCGGSPTKPTTPTIPTTTPPATTVTINGTVVNTTDTRPLSGVTVTIAFNDQQTRTDGLGRYTLTFTPRAPTTTIRFSGEVLERSINVPSVSGPRTDDAISLTGAFDLEFYRMLVRNSLEASTLRPVSRQTQAPRIYLRTVDDSGAPMDALTLDQTSAALINTTGQLTGQFGLAALERGTESREGQRGWITVRWVTTPDPNVCGRAVIGGDAIWLYHKTAGCRCAGGPAVRLQTVKHELGHALGFWHTNNAGDLMYGGASPGCDKNPSAREIYHAHIAYSRPNGNRDPDIDP